MKMHRSLLLVAISLFALVPLNGQTLATAKPPLYPLAARAAGIEGSVKLKALITKEGKVRDIHVLSGAPELQQAAIDAVSNWTYKPYRHFGQLVDVDTTITVNFNMGTGDKKKAEQAKAQAELEKANQPAPSQDIPQQVTADKPVVR